MDIAKISTLLVFCVCSCTSEAPRASAKFASIKPVPVKFEPAKAIFLQELNSELLDSIKAGTFFSKEVLVNSITSETAGRSRGKIWIRRTGESSYIDAFRERPVDLRRIALCRDVSELYELLGDRDMVVGPDSKNIVVGVWRFCNGRPGARFRATELVAGSTYEKIAFIFSREGAGATGTTLQPK